MREVVGDVEIRRGVGVEEEEEEEEAMGFFEGVRVELEEGFD